MHLGGVLAQRLRFYLPSIFKMWRLSSRQIETVQGILFKGNKERVCFHPMYNIKAQVFVYFLLFLTQIFQYIQTSAQSKLFTKFSTDDNDSSGSFSV